MVWQRGGGKEVCENLRAKGVPTYSQWKKVIKTVFGRPSQCIYSNFLGFFDPRLTHGILLWFFLSYLFFRVLEPFLGVLILFSVFKLFLEENEGKP